MDNPEIQAALGTQVTGRRYVCFCIIETNMYIFLLFG